MRDILPCAEVLLRRGSMPYKAILLVTRRVFVDRRASLALTRVLKKDGTPPLSSQEKVVEEEMHIDPRHHRHFVARRGEELRQIAEEFGGVQVSFPRSGEHSDLVQLKGARECVDGARKRILEIVQDLVSGAHS